MNQTAGSPEFGSVLIVELGLFEEVGSTYLPSRPSASHMSTSCCTQSWQSPMGWQPARPARRRRRAGQTSRRTPASRGCRGPGSPSGRRRRPRWGQGSGNGPRACSRRTACRRPGPRGAAAPTGSPGAAEMVSKTAARTPPPTHAGGHDDGSYTNSLKLLVLVSVRISMTVRVSAY